MRALCHLVLVFCLVVLFVPRSSAEWNDEIFSRNPAQPLQRSALFLRISDGQVIYQENADKLLIPASVTKIMTAAAALCKFSPSYQFKTEVSYSGARKDQTIYGDLIIKGSGDPFLTNEKVWQLAADLRHMGLRIVRGNIVIDNTLFVDETRDHSRLSGLTQSTHAYDAPISAFGLNFNTLALAIAPGPKIGQKALVGLDPYDIPSLSILNNIRTVATSAASRPQVSRLSPENDRTSVVLNGLIAIDDPVKKVYRSASDPVLTSGEQVKSFLKHEGIDIQGNVRQAAQPVPGTRPLYTMEGNDLAYIVKGLNHYSNNYIADMLVKSLGAYFGKEGSIDEGIEVIQKFLKEDVGLTVPPVLKNGSGLDSNNQISSKQLAKTLKYMHDHPDVFPEFYASLPMASRDGTMEKRFRSKESSQWSAAVRAKTGTLTEPVTVSSLAGYLYHPKHGLVAFAIIHNGIPKRPQPGLGDLHQMEDMAITRLFQQNGSGT